MAEEIQEAVQIIRVAYDGIEIAMKVGNITIYTSNMNTDNLNVDTRTRDRIVKTCVELQMPEEGIRKKKAAGEQRQFLASVMG